MAQRKKTTRKGRSPGGRRDARAAPKLVGAMVDDDGMLQFSPFDLSRYDLAQHKCANALQGVQLKQNELEAARRAAEQRTRQIEVEIEQLEKTAKENGEELKQLQNELEDAYSLDLSKITFDDLTGRIYIDGEPVVVRERDRSPDCQEARALKERCHG